MNFETLKKIYEPDLKKSVDFRIDFLRFEAGIEVYNLSNISFILDENWDSVDKTAEIVRLLDKIRLKFPEGKDILSFQSVPAVKLRGGIEKVIGSVSRSDDGILYQEVKRYAEKFKMEDLAEGNIGGDIHLIIEYSNVGYFFAVPKQRYFNLVAEHNAEIHKR